MACRMICVVAGMAMAVEGARIDRSKVAQRSAAVATQALDTASAPSWWDTLEKECKACIMDAISPYYSECKKQGGCDGKGSGLKFDQCKLGCKTVARGHGRDVAREPGCSGICGKQEASTGSLETRIEDLEAKFEEVDQLADRLQALEVNNGLSESPSKKGSGLWKFKVPVPSNRSSSSGPDFNKLVVGHPVDNTGIEGALVPELCPRAGQTFAATMTEPNGQGGGLHWKLLNIKNSAGNIVKEYGNKGRFASVNGGYYKKRKWRTSKWQTGTISDRNGKVIFRIRLSRWGLTLGYSFRITHPTFEDTVMFTIIKDKLGRGRFSGAPSDEWRVYNGKKSEHNLLYYGVVNKRSKDITFHHSQQDYDHHEPQVGHYRQAGAVKVLEIQQEEDMALLMATVTVIEAVQSKRR